MPDTLSPDMALRKLIMQLQLAYSGEQAAAMAYRGHWASVRSTEERQHIQQIEGEEWHHRELVGELLSRLGAAPDPLREWRTWVIGKTLGVACHLAGWFLPMYGAGKLERRNVKEYEDAADYAIASGHPDLIDCLLTMAEVEWEHEHYFRERVRSHPLIRLVPLWKELPPKESIRQRLKEHLYTEPARSGVA
ncbi:MAG TPA: ferritin-like domain-containing protein [Thermoanaerobaculia bacterium]|nr:ferritin-like domain-containing protein [Thermoanaerobaculia bacterium]